MEKVSGPGKTTAIIAYLTFIGLIIAFILNNSNKTSLVSFHIRQSLGISLLYIALSVVLSVINIGLLNILYLGVLVLVIIGIMNANNEEEKPVPIVGEHFQKWFAGL